MTIDRRTILRGLGGAAAAWPLRGLGARQETPPRGARPNILVMMTDDQRADAMGVARHPVLKTPNMDRIAREGVRFTEAFVTNSLCSPSRTSCLTGLYSHRHGVTTNAVHEMLADDPALCHTHTNYISRLRDAGYQTALIGKWHLEPNPPGFDHFVLLPGWGGYEDPEMVANGAWVRMRGHTDDIIGDQALLFFERERDPKKPFCMLYSFKAPHGNWTPAKRYANYFDDLEIPLPPTLEDKLQGRPEALRRTQMSIADMGDFGVPKSLPEEERRRLNYMHLVKNYYRVLLSVDDNVGRVLDYLDANGLAENTVVVYTSDNGFFLGEHGFYDKRLMYEPSIRVPFLVRAPGRARPRVDSEHLVLNVDLAPTIFELAGLPVPSCVQGKSLLPLLEGAQTAWRDAFYYEYFEHPGPHCVRKNHGIRTARWKLIEFWEQPRELELYDLARDPGEVKNLAADPKHAATVRELLERMRALRRELGDTDPPGAPPRAAPCP
ncbi:MAG TPA: sulfatase [Thermoanaerobaculia bacterium]|jgi:arylsulfatase A-like enzyme